MTFDQWKSILVDRTQSPEARIKAVSALANSAFDDNGSGSALAEVIIDESDDTTVRCAAVRAMPLISPIRTVNLLLRPFENREVRAMAIAILEEIAMPHRQFVDENVPQQFRSTNVASLPFQYGRAPKALRALKHLLNDPDPQVRSSACLGLVTLGEWRATVDLVNDPIATVRVALATALGSYFECDASETLERLLQDPDPQVAKEAKRALRMIGKIEKVTPGTGPATERSLWTPLLKELSQVQLRDSRLATTLPDEMVAAGWLGLPPATEEEITAAEARLGLRFPPSYREFLMECDGFLHPTHFIDRLRPVREIHLFSKENRSWAELFQTDEDISEEEHRALPTEDPMFRAAYLYSCLQISDVGDNAVVLLNPDVATSDGEWETWLIAGWDPGASRYPSFRHYMERELKATKRLSKQR